MAITVGTDTYISKDDADTYNANMGNSSWADVSDANKEIYLRKATAYLDQAYLFKGEIYDQAQALAWPRSELYDAQGRVVAENSIPTGVKNATAQAAYILSTGVELMDTLDRGGQVKREKVGQLEVEYFTSASGQKIFPQVSAHLQGLTKGSSLSMQAERV